MTTTKLDNEQQLETLTESLQALRVLSGTREGAHDVQELIHYHVTMVTTILSDMGLVGETRDLTKREIARIYSASGWDVFNKIEVVEMSDDS